MLYKHCPSHRPQSPEPLLELKEQPDLQLLRRPMCGACHSGCCSSRAAETKLQINDRACSSQGCPPPQQCRHSVHSCRHPLLHGQGCGKLSLDSGLGAQGLVSLSCFLDSKVPSQSSNSDVLLLIIFY